MRGWRLGVLLTVVLSLLGACTGGGDDEVGGEAVVVERPGDGSWTVMQYSIADTDLEPFMIQDVDEMGEVGTSDPLNIVALVDRAEEYSDDSVVGLDDWTGAKLLQVDPGGKAEVLEDLGAVNTGDPAVLTEFVRRSITEYPADHYALIISDHGASWPGVGGDESTEDADLLTLAELDEAIGQGIESVGVEKLDLLGFDACLMATYEVASVLAPLADRMLASQELEPGHGWDYTALQVAVDEPGISVDDLGSALIDGYEAQAKAEGNSAEITLSLIDLNRMAAVDQALAAFGAAVSERGAAIAPLVGRTRSENLGFGRSPDPEEDTHMTDLGLLATAIGVEALDVSDAADALVRAINDAVLDKVEGQATAGATGLAIYFPPEKAFFDEAYADVVTPAGWNKFLDSYYGAGEAIPQGQRARFAEADVNVTFGEDGLNITALVEKASRPNVAEAFIRYGIVEDDESISFLGEEPASLSDDGSGKALGTFDLTSLTISDDEDSATGFVQLTSDEASETITIDIPMAYYAPGDEDGETYQDALLSLVIDSESGDVVSETYYAYDDENGTFGELTADPEGIIVPEILRVDDDGTEEWISTSDVGLFADLPSLRYDFTDLPRGTRLYVELVIVDFGGNVDSVSAIVTVP